MRRPCLFKERDVKRAARAILTTGLPIERVEIDKNGKIVVVTAKVANQASRPSNDLDDELVEFEARLDQS